MKLCFVSENGVRETYFVDTPHTSIESLSVLTSNWLKRFLLFESSGDIVHVEKSGHFEVDVVLKSLLMRLGKLSDDICNRLDPKITMVTISNVPWCINSTL
jgi:hypothetical protein